MNPPWPPARVASTRWRQASLGFVVILFVGMMVVGKYPQLLKPFLGSHPKPVSRSAATTNSASQAARMAPGITQAVSLGTFSTSNTLEQTNQISRPPKP